MRTINKTYVSFSKKLRKNQTPLEDKLWYHLRAKRFQGLKFKRQVVIGNYIVDFCCNEKKLIIEVDGSQHLEVEISQADTKRQKYLEQIGYKILRFWNNDLNENIDGVLETIRLTLV